MRNAYLIAAGAGLVSALAFVSAMMGAPVTSFFLFMIAALPLYVAGVGWTWAASLLAVSIGSLLLIMLGVREAAIVYAGLIGLPAILLTAAAELRVEVSQTGQRAPLVRWASPGFLVLLSALVAAGISIALMGALQDNLPTLSDEIAKVVKSTPQLSDQQLSDEQIKQIIEIVVLMVPAAAAIVPMLSGVVNLWLAGRIVRGAGQLRRPWPDIAAMRFPRGTPLILAAAAAGTATLTGVGGMAAIAVFGAFFTAYLMLGLAVIHYITRGKNWRPLALSAVYVGLFVVNIWLALPIILLGLADTVFPLRRPPAGGGTT